MDTGRPLNVTVPSAEIWIREAVPGSEDPEVLVVKLQSIIIPATTGMAAPKRTNANRRLVNCVIMANRFFVSE